MRRFFIDPEDISGDIASIKGQEARHISTVLRMQKDDLLQLFDGTGKVYRARIKNIDRDRVDTVILDSSAQDKNDIIPLHLGLAVLKGEKMDLIVQKATELGITGLQPFISAYCAGHHHSVDREAKRLARWQKIVRVACKQCNRASPMTIYPTIDFDDLLVDKSSANKSDLKIIFWEEEDARNLAEIIKSGPKPQSAIIIIGPEGGFSRAEIDRAIAAGFQPASLGSSILRSETAAIAAISIVQFLLGNMDAN